MLRGSPTKIRSALCQRHPFVSLVGAEHSRALNVLSHPWRVCHLKPFGSSCLHLHPGSQQELPRGFQCASLSLHHHARAFSTSQKADHNKEPQASTLVGAAERRKQTETETAKEVKKHEGDAASPSSNWNILRTLSTFLWPDERGYRVRVVASVLSLVLAKVATIQAPIILSQLVDSFGVAPTPEAIPLALLLGYGTARVCASGFGELRNALFARVSQSALRLVANRAFAHLHSLDLEVLLATKSGELSMILSRGIKATTALLNIMLFQVIPTCIEFSLVMYILVSRVGPVTAGVTLGVLVLYYVFTQWYTEYRTRLRKQMNWAEQKANGQLLDSLTNSEAVRYFSNEPLELKRYDEFMAAFERENVKVLQSLAALNFGQQVIFNFGLMVAMGLAALEVSAGRAPVGTLVLVNSLLFQLAIPLNMVGMVVRETSLNLVDMKKLFELMNIRPKVTSPVNAQIFEPRGGGVEFEDVHFSYKSLGEGVSKVVDGKEGKAGSDERETTVMKGVSFKVEPGAKVGIVGPSGCGKSTVLKLIFRLVDPDSGCVRLDGQDLKSLDLHSFRQHIAVVPQDVVLFNDTLLHNLTYSKPEATEDEIAEVIETAQLRDVVESLPNGLNTVVGERGLKLSGGEKQRLGIARCLLRRPQLLLFDEATSALDNETEHKILEALKVASRSCTSMVIAHRLSTVADADLILYLENGRVRESGTHEDLLATRGSKYAQVWRRQLRADVFYPNEDT